MNKEDLSEYFVTLKKGSIDFSNKVIGNWRVLGHKGNGYWLCECQCEKRTRKIQRSYDLKNMLTTNCGCLRREELSNKMFGRWKVLRYTGNQMWLCECQCENHTIKEVKAAYIKSGKSKSCGCLQKELAKERMKQVALNNISDFIGKTIGDFNITSYDKDSYWNATCIKCDKEIKISTDKINNNPYCGCNKLAYKSGDIVNSLEIIQYIGNKRYECKCVCGNVIKARGYMLTRGDIKSCGCLKAYYNLLAHGVSIESAKILINKDELIKVINNFNEKPSLLELALKLDIKYQLCVRYIAKYELHNMINVKYNSSYLEDEIYNLIIKNCEFEVIRRCKNVITPQELDIYIPNLKIAFEFNGDYWHSDEMKDTTYHQDKTIDCAKKGIRLIHIFEHEWLDVDMHDKLESFIKTVVSNRAKIVFGRKTYVCEISKDEAEKFCNKHHLQSYSTSNINIGCFDCNKLLGVMTFGKPRFNHNYEYEIIRLCWDTEYIVIGGTEKMFKYFLDKYNPSSIITYCDISKFKGNIYTKIGFKVERITKPNYVWVHNKSLVYLHRYRTMKAKLIKQGLGTKEQTEDEIMKEKGYLKVYDSGNLLLSWRIKTDG